MWGHPVGPCRVVVHPLVFVEPNGELSTLGGLPELQDAARFAAVRSRSPERALPYLRALLANEGNTYWEDAVRTAGEDPEAVKDLARSAEVEASLRAEASFASGLSIEQPIAFVAANRELVSVRDRRDVLELMERLASRETSGR